MATLTRNPTSDSSVTGTWTGTAGNRWTLVDDYPDTGGTDVATCSAAGILALGCSAISIPANAINISVFVDYYDSKSASQASAIGAFITVGGTQRNATTHNPANGVITQRTDTWATNPGTGAAWTAAEINGTAGGNNLSAVFGLNVTDAAPSVSVTSVQLRITYDEVVAAQPVKSPEAIGSASTILTITLAGIVAAAALGSPQASAPGAPITVYPSGTREGGSGTLTDSFDNPAENPISTPWTSSPGTYWGDIQKTGGALRVTAAATDCLAIYSGASPVADQFSEITIGTVNNAAGSRIYHVVGVRMSSGGAGYIAYHDPTTGGANGAFWIAKGDGTTAPANVGASFNLGALLATGDRVKLSVSGTTLELFLNGSSLGTRTDSSYSSGTWAVGAYCESGSVSADVISAWEGGPVTITATSPTSPGERVGSVTTVASMAVAPIIGREQIGTVTAATATDTLLPAPIGVPERVGSITVDIPPSVLVATIASGERVGTVTVGVGPAVVAPGPIVAPAMAGSARSAAGRFPVLVEPVTRRYLIENNGTPFFIATRTVWVLPSLSAADYTLVLNDTVAKGFTTVEFELIQRDTDLGTNQPPYANNGTLLPFNNTLDGGTWIGGLTYGNINTDAPDFSTPKEAYWAFIDGLLDACEARGLLCMIYVAYVGYPATNQGWMAEMEANGATKIQTYGAFLANRYKNRKNIIWMIGGDRGTGAGAFTGPQTAVEQGLVNGLLSVSPQASGTLVSTLWFGGSIGTDNADFDQHISVNGSYGTPGQAQARSAFSYAPTMPSWHQEGPYDEEGPDGLNFNVNATQPTRRFAYWGWLNAIGGTFNSNGYVWRFMTGWANHLDTQQTRDSARLVALAKSLNWWKLVPRGLGGTADFITAGGGTLGTADYIAAARTSDRLLMVAYIPPAHIGSVTFDASAMAREFRAFWFDPTTGTKTLINTYANSGTQAFTVPGNNAQGSFDDWVLIFDATVTPEAIRAAEKVGSVSVTISSAPGSVRAAERIGSASTGVTTIPVLGSVRAAERIGSASTTLTVALSSIRATEGLGSTGITAQFAPGSGRAAERVGSVSATVTTLSGPGSVRAAERVGSASTAPTVATGTTRASERLGPTSTTLTVASGAAKVAERVGTVTVLTVGFASVLSIRAADQLGSVRVEVAVASGTIRASEKVGSTGMGLTVAIGSIRLPERVGAATALSVALARVTGSALAIERVGALSINSTLTTEPFPPLIVTASWPVSALAAETYPVNDLIAAETYPVDALTAETYEEDPP